MALFDINVDFHRIMITFDAAIPIDLLANGRLAVGVIDAHGVMMYRELTTQYVALDEGERLLPIIAPERVMQMTMPSYGVGQVGYVIEGVFRYAEDIKYSNRLMNMAYDPLAFNCRHRPFIEKGAKVAVFTQAFNEGDMLLYWERFYANLVGHENLFVLNNGSTDGSCQRLNPATNVITMPSVKVDHVEFAQSHGHFQRFLLMRYQWVIKVDTDELLAVEGGLLEMLDKLPSGTYCPELALEPVHDKDNEAPFRFDGALCTQRQHFVVGTKGLIRPLISSVPTSWTPGNHLCFEPNSELPGFVMVHLKYFDFDFLLDKNTKWAVMRATEREEKTCKQIASLNQLDQPELLEFTIKEMAERFAMERFAVPAWLKSTI